MAAPTVDELYEQVIKSLTTPDRLRLVEKIVHDLSVTEIQDSSSSRYDWMTVRGIAPHLSDGEDAQAWVSRTRHEADEQRAQTGRLER